MRPFLARLPFFGNRRLQFLFFAALATGLHVLLVMLSPEQTGVVVYKLALVMLAAIIGIFFDFAVFPYATPESYLKDDWKRDAHGRRENDADFPVATPYRTVFTGACLRRACIVAAFVLAVALGL